MKLDEVYTELLELVSERGARIDVPIESERFFSGIVEGFEGSKQELLLFVQSHMGEWFRWATNPPDWIHEAEWQFTDSGKPMVFLGQLAIERSVSALHDEAAVFVFLDPSTSEVKTVVQVS